MEEGPAVRSAVLQSLREVSPAPFSTRLERTLEGRPLTPGVLAVRTARAVDGTIALEAAAERGAAVQLTYEGLRLTRSIVETEPWPPSEEGDPDVDVVAAEVLVAKGLYKLSHSGVRGRIVQTIQRFGRSLSRDDAAVETSLEADFVVFAIAAGADLAAPTVPPGLVEYARELAAEIEADPLPDGPAIADVGEDVQRIVAAAEPGVDDRSRSSTMDP